MKVIRLLYIAKARNYDQITNNCETSNLQKDDKIYFAKSFVETSQNELITENILIPRDYSASFNLLEENGFQPNKNIIKHNYFKNLKTRQLNEEKNGKLILELDSNAEESNNFTFKKETGENNQNTLNTSIIINSNDLNNQNDNLNCKKNLGYNHFNGEKILIKHSLKKNKSPKFLISPKKSNSRQEIMHNKFNHSNTIEVLNDKASFLSINKETINKYKYLFSDLDTGSLKSMRGLNDKKNYSKNVTHFDDSDLTSLQKYGTVYCSNKTNCSNILATDSDSKNLNLITAKSNALLTDSNNNIKDLNHNVILL